MVKKITKLTAEQRAAIPGWRDKWIKIGLSCEPLRDDDRAEVSSAIRALYRKANLPEPKSIIFVPSPFVMRVASGIAAGVIHALKNGWPGFNAGEANAKRAVDVAVGGAVGVAVGGAVDVAVDVAVRGAVRGAVDVAVGGAVRGAVDVAVRGAVDVAVRGAVDVAVDVAVRGAVDVAVDVAVGGAVRGAVDVAVGGAVDVAVDVAVGGAVGGAQLSDRVIYLLRCAQAASNLDAYWRWWIGWAAHCSFYRDICDLEIAEWESFAQIEAIETCGGCYSLHANFAMVSDRPVHINRDAGGRLHCDDGPAIKWRDGWAMYCWHGLTLPISHQWVIAEPNKLSPEAIEAEPNAELRRVMLERFGFDRYAAARNPKLIAADNLHGQQRRLLEIKVAGTSLRIVEVVNGSLEPDGTQRKFHLGAMPGKTPHDVIAASYGINPKHYREAVRT